MTLAVQGSRVFTPTSLGPIELRNRVVKCATNEGLATAGAVTERLIDWHREYAAGGVAMTTLAYFAVAPDGRTFRDQLWMRPEVVDGLARFTDAMHSEGTKAAVQLTHAGWFAKPEATGERPRGPSRLFSPHAQTFSRAFTEADFERYTEAFVRSARAAVDAGFDGIEVHVGHGYLLSQFLSPWTNRRRDRWGGSIENRARFVRKVLSAVREAVSDRAAIWAKYNMEDGFRGGLTVEDALSVARWIEADGSVDALQLTAGHTTRAPFFTMRGPAPLEGMIENQRSWATKIGLRLIGPRLLASPPFEEGFLLPTARRFREALSLPLMLLGGINRLETMEQALEEGFEYVALARALIRDPDLVERLRSGDLIASRCTACNECIVQMERGGTRCVLR